MTLGMTSSPHSELLLLDVPPSLLIWNRQYALAADIIPRSVKAWEDNLPDISESDTTHYISSCRTWPLDSTTFPIIFVHTMALPHWIDKVLPIITQEFVLVTGMCDPGPLKVLGISGFNALLGSKLLRAWFSEMADALTLQSSSAELGKEGGDHVVSASPPAANSATASSRSSPSSEGSCSRVPIIQALPLGFDFHTLAYKPSCRPTWGPSSSFDDQETALVLSMARARASPSAERDPRCYVHFGWYNRPRRIVLKAIQKNPSVFHIETERDVPRAELWRRYSSHRWVLAIQGAGIDSHRAYEAWAHGCGVIAEDMPFLRQLAAANLDTDNEGDAATPSTDASLQPLHSSSSSDSPFVCAADKVVGESSLSAATATMASTTNSSSPAPGVLNASKQRIHFTRAQKGRCPTILLPTDDAEGWSKGLDLDLLNLAWFDGIAAPSLTSVYWKRKIRAAALKLKKTD